MVIYKNSKQMMFPHIYFYDAYRTQCGMKKNIEKLVKRNRKRKMKRNESQLSSATWLYEVIKKKTVK